MYPSLAGETADGADEVRGEVASRILGKYMRFAVGCLKNPGTEYYKIIKFCELVFFVQRFSLFQRLYIRGGFDT